MKTKCYSVRLKSLEKWAVHAVLGRIHRIAKERNYTIHNLTMTHE